MRQTACEGCFVDVAFLQLALQLIGEMVELFQQFVVARMSTHSQTQVAAADKGIGGIGLQQRFQRHILRVEDGVVGHQKDVVHVSLQTVVALKVGGAVYVEAEGGLQRVVGNAEGLQVGVSEIYAQGEVGLACQQGIQVGLQVHEAVVGLHAGMASSAADAGFQSGAVEVVGVIAGLCQPQFSIQPCAAAHEVGAGTFYGALRCQRSRC